MGGRDHAMAQQILLDAVRAYALDRPWTPHLPSVPDAVAALARDAALLPVLLREAGRAGVEVPGWTAAARTHLSMWKLAQQADLNRAAACLDRAGVRWMVLKGPVLDTVVFRSPGLRTYSDVDVLIHPDDFEAGWHALQTGGAEDLDVNWRRLAETGQSEISLRLRAGTHLDLHWHVISNRRARARFGLDSRELFEHVTTVDVGGRTLPTLDRATTLQYLCLHAALSGGHQLKWVLDVQQAQLHAGAVHGPLAALDLVTAVMLDRVSRTFGQARPRGRGTGPWREVCDATSRRVPVSAGPSDGYSGQVVFWSTRTDTLASLRALTRSVWQSWYRGRARRTAALDRSILDRREGTPADLAAWLATVRATP